MRKIRQGNPPRWIAAVGMCALVVSCSCGSGEAAAKSGGGMVLAAAPDSPAVFSEVGAFELVERSGAKVKREDLLGRPWVASFVFTRCTGPCPKVVGTLKKLQARLEDGGARIVTFSVDPEWDSPEVLRRYAAEVGANPQRWLFLTGEEKAIRALISNSFLSAAERAPVGEAPIGQQVSHSTRLVAVDKKCRVRGFYAGESDEDVDLLVQRLAFLQGERD